MTSLSENSDGMEKLVFPSPGKQQCDKIILLFTVCQIVNTMGIWDRVFKIFSSGEGERKGGREGREGEREERNGGKKGREEGRREEGGRREERRGREGGEGGKREGKNIP